MKAIIYARVSTDKQNHDSQLQDLRVYCTRHGWTEVEEISAVISGAKSSRKGLDRLMAAVRRGKVDIVVCFKLDRLGRSLSHLAQIELHPRFLKGPFFSPEVTRKSSPAAVTPERRFRVPAKREEASRSR
jgi:Resolvase, N terminal domain